MLTFFTGFLEFLESVDHWRSNAINLQGEVQRLQTESQKSQAEIRQLELKLKNARHLLDLEKGKRMNVDKEKNDLVCFIIARNYFIC